MTNFDFPYLVNRAKHLKVDGFSLLGRVLGERSVVKDLNFQSKQLGKRENKFVEILGRVQFDLLPVIQRDYKLRYNFLFVYSENIAFAQLKRMVI